MGSGGPVTVRAGCRPKVHVGSVARGGGRVNVREASNGATTQGVVGCIGRTPPRVVGMTLGTRKGIPGRDHQGPRGLPVLSGGELPRARGWSLADGPEGRRIRPGGATVERGTGRSPGIAAGGRHCGMDAAGPAGCGTWPCRLPAVHQLRAQPALGRSPHGPGGASRPQQARTITRVLLRPDACGHPIDAGTQTELLLSAVRLIAAGGLLRRGLVRLRAVLSVYEGGRRGLLEKHREV